MQKQLNDLVMKIQMTNLVLARQNDTANTLMRLLSFGITEDQILKACRFIEMNGNNFNSHYAKSINPQFGFELSRQ
jgi:hypothetical protein